MLQTYLVNILIFCAILLLIALTVGAVQLIIILLDFRRMTRAVKEKFMAVISMLDIVALIAGALGGMKGKMPGSSTITAFIAGLKKALQALLKKGGDKDG